MVSRTRLASAVRALRAELAGGPGAELRGEIRELAELLAAREKRRDAIQDPVAQELLSALPDAAAMVEARDRIRVANASFDALAAGARAAGQRVLEVTRSAELAGAVRNAREGTATRLEVELQRRSYQADVAPLPGDAVLLLLRDVTDARRAQATRRDFVANASHELRTPIAAIGVAVEALQRGGAADTVQARRVVSLIARNAQRLSRLTQDLLDLSRIESRQWKLDRLPVEVRQLAQQVVELLAGRAAEKSLELLQAVPGEALVRADAHALEHVLVNLADNAIKYTGAGRVTLTAERDDSEWVISVRDTGPGIERHHLPRIFERFYRTDPARSREQGGTGLGLAIVRHLVQAMGGQVGVESGADGSRFWVRLPVA